MGRILGLRDISPNMWPTSPERSGVFVNLARATEPTVRPDSRALEEGDIYYNTTDDLLYVYTGASWTSVGATGGSVTLTGAYNNGGGTLTKVTTAVTVNDADTDSSNTLVINKTGAGSGNLLDINMTAAMTGDAVNVTMTNGATTAQALVIESQAAVRATNALVQIDENGTGAVPTVNIAAEAATTGPLLRLNASTAAAPVAGTDGMMTIALATVADASEGLFIVNTTTSRTGACLGISDGGTSTGPLIRLVQTSTSAADVIQYTTSGAITGDVIDIDLTNAGTAGQALVVVGQAAGSTNALVDITSNSTSTGCGIHINCSNTAAGDGLLIDADAAFTGNLATLTMTTCGNSADGLVIGGTLTGRTGRMALFTDTATTGTGPSLEINSTGAKDGSHLVLNVDGTGSGKGIHFDYDGANTGAIVHFDIDAATTGPVFDIDLDSTGSSVLFDIDIGTGVWTGDIFNFNTSQAYAGDVFDIVLTNCAAGVQAMVITGSATTRTAHLIEITEAGTPSGDVINISHGGASTGDGIHMVMTNAVGARCLNLDGAGTRTVNLIDIDTTGADTASCVDITTTAVGASNVPGALGITGTADLVAGADLARFVYTGSPSSTSNVLAIEQSTGAGSAGAYAVYVSATGTNVEAIKVDDGLVAFDEGISGSIIGATGQTVAAGGTSTALTVAAFWHHIDADAGGDTFTLADGTTGQLKIITMESATGTATITPTNAAGYTSVTFNAAGDSVMLLFTDSKWYVVGGNSYTLV